MVQNYKIRVLFVCTGNICRSPMAEAVFQNFVDQQGLTDRFEIESAGTAAYHVGERPHIGTQRVLKQNNVPLAENKQAAAINRSTLHDVDHVIALDSGHVMELKKLKPVKRMLEFATGTHLMDVPEPYYEENFEEVFDLVADGCKGLLKHISDTEGILVKFLLV